MTTRELLIREINHAPEDVLQETLRYLRQEMSRRELPQHRNPVQTTGAYVGYWNQYMGIFAGEAWERPDQGTIDERKQW